MARQWRIQYKGAIYHVMSRGIEKGVIFLSDEDCLRFLECIKRTVEKFKLEIFAFVLMGNHYHLLLRTPEANLSKSMQWLQTSYSVYYNLKHKRSGHLFQGRYKSILVGEESYWQNLSFYIHLNPICAGMVNELNDYRWSSYHDYVGPEKVHRWVLSEEILKELSESKQDAQIKYRKLIIEVCGRERKVLEDIKYGLVLGSEKFISRIQKEFINRKSMSDELPQQRMLGDNKIIERVLDEVGKEFGVEKDRLINRKIDKPEVARDVGMYILGRHTGLDNREIGELFGVSRSAVSKVIVRIIKQMRNQKELEDRINVILHSTFKV
ncbi:MAG: transposase [Candidatus Firestonebacteria bacterium]